MTTPKELADKARAHLADYDAALIKLGSFNKRAELHATIDQLQAMAEARQGSGEPVAWSYELATRKAWAPTEHYTGWEPRLSKGKPNVPAESIRNLTPLYPPSAQQATGSGQVLTEANAAHAENLRRLADIGKDCGRLVSKDGRAWADMHAAADALAAATQAAPDEKAQELSAALGWPGGVSDPELSWVELLRKVAKLRSQALTPATAADIARRYGTGESLIHVPQDYVEGWRDSEKHHGITGEQPKGKCEPQCPHMTELGCGKPGPCSQPYCTPKGT